MAAADFRECSVRHSLTHLPVPRSQYLLPVHSRTELSRESASSFRIPASSSVLPVNTPLRQFLSPKLPKLVLKRLWSRSYAPPTTAIPRGALNMTSSLIAQSDTPAKQRTNPDHVRFCFSESSRTDSRIVCYDILNSLWLLRLRYWITVHRPIYTTLVYQCHCWNRLTFQTEIHI